MSGHTPGPWRPGRSDMVILAGPNDDAEFYKNVYCDDPRGGTHMGKALPFTVARAFGDEQECIANARLIAAAPDLLAAVKVLTAAGTGWEHALHEAACLVWHQPDDPNSEPCRCDGAHNIALVEAAVARAEGKETDHG